MTSEIDIINFGLNKLGLDPIVSTSDNVKAARSMAGSYDRIRQSELRAHQWKFAEIDINISADAATPIFTWLYSYTMPSDCLQFRAIVGTRQTLGSLNYRTGMEGERLYTIKGRKILTNLSGPLPVTYTSDVTDTTQWDVLFDEVIACKLAFENCVHLTQNRDLKADLAKEYKRALNQALISGSVELPPEGIADDSFVYSRL